MFLLFGGGPKTDYRHKDNYLQDIPESKAE